MFLGGLNIKQFLSDHKEWHALVDGFGIGFCPFLLLVSEIRKQLAEQIRGELHYFIFGVVLGVIGAVWFWVGVFKVIT